MPRVARGLAALVTGLSLAMVLVPASVVAARPAAQALNPEPPDTYTCTPTGGGTICRAHTVDPYALVPQGIECGTGPTAFEVLDSGVADVRATRWYDRDGNLTRRQRILQFDSYLSNSRTGATLGYHQHNTDWDVLSVPGDLTTSTWHGHGVLTVNVPGHAAVWKGAGVVVVGPDGTILHWAGQDKIVLDALCAALGG
jgi:hypothetical protein